MKATRILAAICAILFTTSGLWAQLQADFSHTLLIDPECVQPYEAAHVQLIGKATGDIARFEWATDQPAAAQIALGAVHQNPILNLDLTRGVLPDQVVVTLIVHDSTGNTDSTSKTIDTDFHFAPFVNFSPRYALQECGEASLEFSNMSKSPMGSNLTNFDWDLGNGENSSETNPTQEYTEPGDYTIELTVTDETGCSSTSEAAGVFLQLEVLNPENCE